MNYKQKYIKYKLKYKLLKAGSPESPIQIEIDDSFDKNKPLLDEIYKNIDGTVKKITYNLEISLDDEDEYIPILQENYYKTLNEITSYDIKNLYITTYPQNITNNNIHDFIKLSNMYYINSNYPRRNYGHTLKSLEEMMNKYGRIDYINTKNVTNMKELFKDIVVICDISNWNVSNVTNMDNMFHNSNLNGYDLSKWKLDNLKSMNNIFDNCKEFDINKLDNFKLKKLKLEELEYDRIKEYIHKLQQEVSKFELGGGKNN